LVGGPGGSGINFLGRAGEELSTIVNTPTSGPASADAKYFDFISWDPRGVNNTTPRLNCFPDAASSDVWNFQNEADGIDANSTAGVSHLWARSKALGEGCSHGNEILEHMNTAPVVADMVAIIERHGEWRSKIAESWLESCEGRSATKNKEVDSLYSKDAILERTRWRKGEEKLLYWGFSYGTLIGSTFSTLQPHRVGRIILDGVVDSTDYYHAGWLSNLQDTDPIMDHFYEYCSAAGPTKCALNLGNTTAAEIKSQVEALVPNLREDPIAVPGTATLGPEIITYSDMMQMIRNVLYSPIKRFPQMAELLADLIHGNGTAFASFKKQLHKPSCPLQGCPNPNAEPCLAPTAWETTAAIMCSDATDVSNGTKDDLKRIITTLIGQSKWMGEAWSTIAMQCIHWKARAAWTLKAEDVGGNTSHPVLLIGNTLDTVTPLRNAITMSTKFPGSVVLQQNSDGHCSGSSPSICTSKYIRDYFQTGGLPAKGVVCQPEELPLIGKIGSEERILSVEEQKVLEAMERLKDVIDDVRFFAPV
jgi:pimeloyl-ACP methyl ester carboxylesterase